MPESKYVLAESLGTCSLEPRTGVTLSGTCETGPQAIGSHTASDVADLKRHVVDIS